MHLSRRVVTLLILFLLMASTMLMYIQIKPVEAQRAAEQPVSGSIPAGVTPSYTVKNVAYLSFRPNPVGLGQTFLVNMWTSPGLMRERMHQNYKVTITKPDGKTEAITMNSYCADATAWFEYVADQVGEWKLKFEFPGEYYPAGRYLDGYIVTGSEGTQVPSAYYPPSSTQEQTLVVQEQIVPSWPITPLPTDYWTRPVSINFREWAPILGDYPWNGPGGGASWPADTNIYWDSRYRFTPYVQGPNSAHIVWKREGAISGILGSDLGQKSITSGGGTPSIIFQGRCYQTVTKPTWVLVNGTYRMQPTTVWQSYNLRTGEVYWELTDISAPTVIEYATGTSQAVPGEELRPTMPSLVYIGNGRLIKYNPYSGAVTANVSISPITSGTYNMNGYALAVQDLGTSAGANRYRLLNWTTLGTSTNFTSRIVSNISWPLNTVTSGMSCDLNAGIVAQATGIGRSEEAWSGTRILAISLKTGQVLWNITVEENAYDPMQCLVADHGKFAVLMIDGYWMAWDLNTGKLAWKSEPMAYPWSRPGFGAYSIQTAYGLFWRQAYDGVYAFDWDTGKIVWKYTAPANAYETPYTDENGTTVFSFNAGASIVDGKLYTYNTEHTPGQPATRGWKLHCVNATTGEGIWSTELVGSVGPIADGYMTVSGNDGYMYVYGKGKSTTTVTVSPKTIAKASSVLIEGTVLDQSPAQPGTPCISKESMATYMEYLHMQKPIPTDYVVTGVPIQLYAIGTTGNMIDLGKATSDVSGSFKMAWTPPDEGLYTITANFAGDDSYGSSWAETGLSVGPAPATNNTEQQQEIIVTDYTMTIIGVGIALAIVIIVAVAIAVLILKKK